MNTEILRAGEEELMETAKRAGEIWRAGGLVAFPTETVYGLGGNGLNAESSKKIYAAKGRPSDNPLILHVGRIEQIEELVTEIPDSAEKVMNAFFPGPLTMILKKAPIVPFETSGGLSTVAIRMPSHPVAAALLKEAGVPIAAPSANLSGRPSPTAFRHVLEDMDGRIDAIIDGGEVGIGVESSIIDLTGEVPVILRPGYVTQEMLQKVLGEVEIDPAITSEGIIHHTEISARPKAPGMKYRHYAPKAPVTVVYGEIEQVARAVSLRATEKTVILTTDEHKNLYTAGRSISLGKTGNGNEIAHNLFDALRKCDELSADAVYSEDFTDADFGGAVMNRLLKAAGGNYIKYDALS